MARKMKALLSFVDNLMYVHESSFIGTARENVQRAEAPNAMYVGLCWNTGEALFVYAPEQCYIIFFNFVFPLLCPSLTML